MPPRSYYITPRADDYLSYAKAFFPREFDFASRFSVQYSVPYIIDETHLAAYIGVSPSLIRQICHDTSYHYRPFRLRKSDGSFREIHSPKTYLKVVQWWISDNILELSSLDDCVHGFRRGRSYITNAQAHVGAKHLLNVDVERFFPSISREMVSEVFQNFGYGTGAGELLAALTTLDGAAPTGAPTSPSIGNIILNDFDLLMKRRSQDSGIRYTRYADDLSFSSQEWISVEFLGEVRSLIGEFGFRLNESKTKFMGRGDRMEVTGLTINNGVKIPRKWRNNARAVVHRAKLNPAEFYEKRHIVYGIYGTLKSIDPDCTNALTREARRAIDTIIGR